MTTLNNEHRIFVKLNQCRSRLAAQYELNATHKDVIPIRLLSRVTTQYHIWTVCVCVCVFSVALFLLLLVIVCIWLRWSRGIFRDFILCSLWRFHAINLSTSRDNYYTYACFVCGIVRWTVKDIISSKKIRRRIVHTKFIHTKEKKMEKVSKPIVCYLIWTLGLPNVHINGTNFPVCNASPLIVIYTHLLLSLLPLFSIYYANRSAAIFVAHSHDIMSSFNRLCWRIHIFHIVFWHSRYILIHQECSVQWFCTTSGRSFINIRMNRTDREIVWDNL